MSNIKLFEDKRVRSQYLSSFFNTVLRFYSSFLPNITLPLYYCIKYTIFARLILKIES